MQQQGVIIAAVVLALILAGGLWYSLAQDSGTPATETPTSSPTTTPEPRITDTAAIDTVAPQDVATTAPSGAALNVVMGVSLLTLASLWQLRRSWHTTT